MHLLIWIAFCYLNWISYNFQMHRTYSHSTIIRRNKKLPLMCVYILFCGALHDVLRSMRGYEEWFTHTTTSSVFCEYTSSKPAGITHPNTLETMAAQISLQLSQKTWHWNWWRHPTGHRWYSMSISRWFNVMSLKYILLACISLKLLENNIESISVCLVGLNFHWLGLLSLIWQIFPL